jgi:nitric oxide reductase large subunit
MTETVVDSFQSNQLFAEAKAATITDVVRSLDKEERKETKKELHDIEVEDNINRTYNEYVEAYIQFFNDGSYEKSMKDNDGIIIPAKIWGSKKSQIQKK